jgi:phosphoglycerate kinase
MIKSIANAELEGKKVLVRSDFNIPIDPDGTIRSFTKINDSLPTIDLILKKGGIPILMSHLGRPKNGPESAFSLRPVADYFNAIGYCTIFVDDCIGPKVEEAVKNAKRDQIVFLENVRFYEEETNNDIEFARTISKYGDIFCNNAFGTLHRAHATTDAIAQFFPNDKYAGLLVLKEVRILGKALSHPEHPFTAIIGGSKITGKIDIIRNLFTKCDNILIGGGMMFTFFKARGYEIGNSLVETDKITLAREIMEEARKNDIKFYLPTDVVEADKFANDAFRRTVHRRDMDPNMMGLDIGEETIRTFSRVILTSKTVLWNGPMGVFEFPNFARGTLALAHALAKCTSNGGLTIVGGGDSARAIQQLNYENKISHISTGGGASLEFLEGKVLPGIAALEC